MTADLLLELLSEEIPARMQAGARNDLARMFADELERAGLSSDAIEVFSTPRRLALIARAVPLETQARSEEIKGPRTSAPPTALEGFLRKTGLTRDQLEERDGVLFAVVETAGQPTLELLGPMIERIVRDFPWPKSMRWGEASADTGSLRWVRPLHGIVAMLGEDIVAVAIDGIRSGATSVGHRFHHPGPITIGGAGDYAEKLRACHVIVDQDERERIIREGAVAVADSASLRVIEDGGLMVENAGLTEWPVPLLGSFDREFLEIPREVIELTMRTNQKYFACITKKGGLTPHFVCIANIDANDGGEAIVEGNRRVLAARLADARFFWEQDLKVPLQSLAPKLKGVVFHKQLGSLHDKVRRVGLLLGLFSGGRTSLAALKAAFRVSALAKADLLTSIVTEFPELQGRMGAKIAQAQGYSDIAVSVIANQYTPTGNQGQVPHHVLSQLHNLCDNLDTIVAFFAVGIRPTGSRDPMSLRRAALSALRLILEPGLRTNLKFVIRYAVNNLGIVASANAIRTIARRYDLSAYDAEHELNFDEETRSISYYGQKFELDDDIYYSLKLVRATLDNSDNIVDDVFLFIIDRLKVQQREAGVRHDLIDAVFALGGEADLVRLLARVRALQEFVETGDGADLLTAYKRAANILKKEKWSGEAASAPAREEVKAQEQALISALDEAEERASAAVEVEDFTGAMAALASLRLPIDAFFDHVTVNVDDAGTRARRLNLLARFRDAVHRVADFSKIEG